MPRSLVFASKRESWRWSWRRREGGWRMPANPTEKLSEVRREGKGRVFQGSRNISWDPKKDEKRERGWQTWWTNYNIRWFKLNIPQLYVVEQAGSYKKQIEEAEEISTINLCKKSCFPISYPHNVWPKVYNIMQLFVSKIIYILDLGKFRRVEGELLGAEDRAGMRETVLSRWINSDYFIENNYHSLCFAGWEGELFPKTGGGEERLFLPSENTWIQI